MLLLIFIKKLFDFYLFYLTVTTLNLFLMGQQHNKHIKRRRRKLYLDRKKAIARQLGGIKSRTATVKLPKTKRTISKA